MTDKKCMPLIALAFLVAAKGKLSQDPIADRLKARSNSRMNEALEARKLAS